jgi:hypothetical protein
LLHSHHVYNGWIFVNIGTAFWFASRGQGEEAHVHANIIFKVVIHNNLMVQALQMLSLENAAQETVIESLLCIAASSRHARGLLLIISEKKNQSVYGW